MDSVGVDVAGWVIWIAAAVAVVIVAAGSVVMWSVIVLIVRGVWKLKWTVAKVWRRRQV